MPTRWRYLCLATLWPLAAVPADAPLALHDAWVRALPPTATTTAAYLTVENPGSVARAVTRFSAEGAASVELHRTVTVDGMARMEAVPELTVAPGERVQFAPGGLHLMLLGLTRMPAPGESLRLCLQLDDGGEVCTVAPVRRAEGGDDNAHSGHH